MPGGAFRQAGADEKKKEGKKKSVMDGRSSIINQQFKSKEGRLERLETAQSKNLLNGVTRIFGGPDKFSDTMQKMEAEAPNDWVKKMPAPHRELGPLTAFSMLMESGPHGDQHELIREFSDQYAVPQGSRGNYVLPFMRLGWDYGKPTPDWFLVVNHPEDHLKIGTEHLMKSPVYDAVSYGRHFLSEMDVSDEGEWRRRRLGSVQTVQPFHIKKYFHKMERHARNLIRRFQNGEEGTLMYGASTWKPSFNLHEMVADTAFKVAAECLYGLEDEPMQEWSRKIRWAIQRPEVFSTGAMDIMKQWATMLKEWPAEKRGPLLQAMVETNDEHTREEFGGAAKAWNDDVMLLTLANHDTTAATMTACLMELARRPELQQMVADEAREVLKGRSGPDSMTYDDLYKMPLLTKCINETLRMWNAVSFGSQRQLMWDEEIHCGPGLDDTVTVPKGTTVMIQNFTNHRSKELWGEDADQWNPWRWEGFGDIDGIHFGGEGQDHHSCTYAARNPESHRFHPFTRAPRDCFGKNFAQAEMRVVLPVLLSQLEFRLAEPTITQVETNVEGCMYQLSGVLKPRDGLWVHCEPRGDIPSFNGDDDLSGSHPPFGTDGLADASLSKLNSKL